MSEPINIYSTDRNGFEKLSNMFNGPIQLGSKTFPTVEHMYQYHKAKFACDTESMDKILNAETGWDVWKLAKKIKGLESTLWDGVAYEALKFCMELAFNQNPKQKKLLLKTEDRLLLHKSPKGYSLGRWEQDFPEILMNIREKLQ